jgi:hypothetical protein
MKTSTFRLGTVLLLVLTVASGCKKKSSEPKSDPKIDKLLADAEKKSVDAIEVKLKFIEGLRGTLAPPTTKDGVTLDKEWASALWVHEVDLGTIGATPKGPRVKDAEDLRNCVKEARTPDFGKRTIAKLDKCESARWLYVVRTLARTEPKVTEQAKGVQAGKFIPGTASGDVLVYDLRDKKHVGGYRWKASNDSSVIGGTMMKDFEDNILEAIQAGYLAHVKR